MRKINVGDSVVTKWDEWSENGKRMVVPGEVVSVTRGHREMVYGVKMQDNGKVEEVRANQIS